MLTKFFEGVGSSLAERWAGVAGPAVVFWLGGIAAWVVGGGDLEGLTAWLEARTTVEQIALLLAGLVAVLASGLAVDRMTFPLLRLLEGYWPSALSALRRHRLAALSAKVAEEDRNWQRLAPTVLGTPELASPDDVAAFTELDQRRRRRPADPGALLPTHIGNILRAAERWPGDKYGLDAVVVWPRLWLLLPDTTRSALATARTGLDRSVAAVVWGALFTLFGLWTAWAIPVGILVAAVAVRLWVPSRAEVFSDLLEAAFDLHRTLLYQELRFPLPENPKQERLRGQQLTRYLWRGSDDDEPEFTSEP